MPVNWDEFEVIEEPGPKRRETGVLPALQSYQDEIGGPLLPRPKEPRRAPVSGARAALDPRRLREEPSPREHGARAALDPRLLREDEERTPPPPQEKPDAAPPRPERPVSSVGRALDAGVADFGSSLLEGANRVPDAAGRVLQGGNKLIIGGLNLLGADIDSDGKVPGLEQLTDPVTRQADAVRQRRQEKIQSDPYRRELSEKMETASGAVPQALEGDFSGVKDTLTDPEALAYILGNAGGSLAASIATGGGTKALMGLEGLQGLNEAADYEQRTGEEIPTNAYIKSLAQRSLVGGALEKSGLDSILGASGKGAARGAVRGGTREGLTETGQEINANLAQRHYDPEAQLTEGLLPALVGGTGAGSLTGALVGTTGAEEAPKPDLIPELTPSPARAALDLKAHEAATSPLNERPEPTEGQKKAGNYAKGHVRLNGLDISIENPQGSTRSGTDPDGNAWSQEMQDHYGYVRGTEGKDGDQVDVFIADKATDNDKVFVIDQEAPDGRLDEHKAILGAETPAEARAIYERNYQPGWDGFGGIKEFTARRFKEWLNSGGGKRRVDARKRDVRKAAGRGIEVTGIHYGREGGLTELRGDQFGTGSRGKETNRLAGAPERLRNRSYFYLQQEDGRLPEPEPVVTGRNVYQAELSGMYDANADPEGLMRQAQRQGGDVSSGFEELVLDRGYRGYVDRKALGKRGAAVVLQEKTPVRQLGPTPHRAREVAKLESGPLRQPHPTVTAEVIPSDQTEAGAWAVEQDVATQRDFSRKVRETTIRGGEDHLARKLGIPYTVREGAGAYGGGIHPNIILDTTDAEKATDYALAMKHIYQQDAVPWFRADESRVDDPEAALGIRVRVEDLDDAKLTEIEAALIERLGPDVGFTQTDSDEIVIINFRGDEGPFLADDRSFSAAVKETFEARPDTMEMVQFGADSAYLGDDWSDERIEQHFADKGDQQFKWYLRDRRTAAQKAAEEFINGRRQGQRDSGSEAGRPDLQAGRGRGTDRAEQEAEAGREEDEQAALTEGLSRDLVSATVHAVTAKWRGAPPVSVVQHQDQLPLTTTDRTRFQGRSIRGYVRDGQVWLVADNLHSKRDALQTMLHEVVGHMGMRGLMGDRFNALLDQVWTSVGRVGLKQIAEVYGLDLDTKAGRHEAAEEYLAHLAETNRKPKLLSRIVATVRRLLRQAGLDIKLSHSDIRALLSRARDHVKAGSSGSSRFSLISTRVPSAKKATENPLKDRLVIGIESMQLDPKSYAKNVDLVSGYVNFPAADLGGDVDERAEAFINQAKDNLLWLHDQVPATTRKRTRGWYNGARKLVDRWAERYQLTDAQVSGVIASLSPQKDWDMNVSLAERLLDITQHGERLPWTQQMTETAERIFGDPRYAPLRQQIDGRALSDLDDVGHKAMWVRIYDEAHHQRRFRSVSPEGDFGAYRTTNNGDIGKAAWGDLGTISKAISITEDGSAENISAKLGMQHKVRNFYNNIFDPDNTEGHVTIDTHAVAAALLRPLSGNSAEVLHNFGGTGSAKSSITGSGGTYGLYAEAYRRAAAERGTLPREMQSITWEAVRGLFPGPFKRPTNMKDIDAIWREYRNGQADIDSVRSRVSRRAGGIQLANWEQSVSGHDGEGGDSSYPRQLSEPRVPRGGTGPAAGGDPGDDSAGAVGGRASIEDPNLDALRKKIGPRKQGLRERFADTTETFRAEWQQGLFDSLKGIERAENAVLGEDVPVSQSAYVAARMATGTPGQVDVLLRQGTLEWRDNTAAIKEDSKGLLQILEPVRDKLDDWLIYMVARRASRLAEEGRENLLSEEEIAAGLELGEQNPAFQEAAEGWGRFNKDMLDFAQDAGLIDPATRPLWEQSDYVPFYRVMDDGEVTAPRSARGLAQQNAGIKRLKGGEQNIGDVLDNMMMNSIHLLSASMKNHAIRMATENLQGTDLITDATPDFRPALVPLSEAKKALETAGVDTSMLPPESLEGMQKMMSYQPPSGPDVVRVMVKGRPRYFHVHDPLLFRSLTSIDKVRWGKWMEGLRIPKRVLTQMVTADPGFIARNFIRDTLQAFVVARDPTTPVISSFTGAAQSFRSAVTGNMSEAQQTIMAAGGGFTGSGYVTSGDPQSAAREVRAMLAAQGIKHDNVIDSARKYMHLWQRVSGAAEQANRIAVFESAKEAGKTDLEAAYEAKDFMDFSMRGDWAVIQFLAETVPFFSARMAGNYRLGRGASEKPLAFLAKGGLIALASVALYLQYRDDERYKALEDWDRNTYYHFWIGDEHFRLPKPFEVGALFSTLPERGTAAVMDWIAGQEGVKAAREFGDQLAWVIGETFNMGSVTVPVGKARIPAPVPQTFAPAVEAFANYDSFRERPIVGMGEERLPAGMQYDYRTSPTMIEFGKRVGLSPKKLEHLMNGYFGTMGNYLLSATDAVVREVGDHPSRPASRGPQDWPVIKSFYRGSDMGYTRYGTEFYELAREVEGARSTLSKLKKEGRLEEAREFVDDNIDLLRASKASGRVRRKIGEINKRIEALHRSDLSPTEKRRRLDQLTEFKNKELQRAAEGIKYATGR